MTRKKKSRKPGVGSIGISKNDKSLLDKAKDKKPKKKTGKASGSRQQEGLAKKKQNSAVTSAKDPRVGSKKPIVLGQTSSQAAPVKNKPKKANAGIAAIRTIEQAPTVAQQLAAIEADERLQLILAKQEQDETLSEEEVDYYNDLMEQYDKLSAQLEPEQETAASDQTMDDDDLWDKLDNSDFSAFKEE